jgi:hypothetical protein
MRESERVEILLNLLAEQRFLPIPNRMLVTGASAAAEAA